MLNRADVLPVPKGTLRSSPPLHARFLCWRKILGEYAAHRSRYCFSYLSVYYRGGEAKSYEGMKTPLCYEGQNLD